MEHNRRSRRSTRGIASSSRQQFDQDMPESGHLSPIPANPSNVYNFNARMRMTASMKETESRMKDLKVLTPIYPHIPSLEELNILDEVKEHFVANGFGFVFMADPPCVYEALVREFIYSFVPNWVEHDAPRCGTYVAEWTFRLNGERFRYSRRDLLRIFNIPNEDSFPIVDRETRNDFWRMISGTHADYVSQQAASKITSPIWKFVHRFIATCVHLRKDEGRWVSKTDIDLMCCFHKQLSVDTISFLTDALEESTIPSFRGTYIGGGHIVTLLAEDLGLTLDPAYAYPLRFLKEEEMLRRGFIKTIRLDNGLVKTFLVGRDTIPGERPPPPHPSTAGPSTHPIPPHYPPHTVSNEELSAQIQSLQTYTHEGLLWASGVFSDMYTRLGYEPHPPPPPYPPQYAHAPHEDYAGSHEADDGDDMDEDSSSSEKF